MKLGVYILKKQTKRMNAIIDFLKTKNGASIKELANLFQVSDMTIRRDVSILSEQGLVSNLYGAVVISPDVNSTLPSYNLDNATTSNQIEKNRIGQFAASLIKSNDILIIDTGSTTEALARHISSDIPLTILCNTQNVLKHLLTKPQLKLIFAGGFYHPNTQLFESNEGRKLISNVRATKVFMSAAGVHESMGVTCVNSYEVDNKLAIMQSGFERILLVDSAKFSVIQSSYFADLNQFHTIITDSEITPVWVSLIENLGIKLHVV